MRRDISRTSPLDVRSLSRLFTNKLATDGLRLSQTLQAVRTDRLFLCLYSSITRSMYMTYNDADILLFVFKRFPYGGL